MDFNKDLDSMIDDLLSGKLSPSEEANLMQQINQTPELKADFQFQSDIVNSLKETRRAELKARLDAVVIEPGVIGAIGASSLLKYGASLLVATSVGIGAYYYLNQPSGIAEMQGISPKTANIDLSKIELPQLPDQLQKFDLHSINESTLTASTKVAVEVIKPVSEKPEVMLLPELAKPIVAETFDDEMPTSPQFEGLPNKKSVLEEVKTEIENIENSKYPFHYRFFESKLFLYGDFKGIPYEIIEIHGKNGRTTYLNYKGEYYLLKSSVREIVPLEAIKDAALIQELDLLKKEKS